MGIEDSPAARRRSPGWVRQLDRQQLHGLTGRLVNLWRAGDISPRQDWLLDACFSELDYRQRHPEVWARCSCEWCCSPFPEPGEW